MASRSPSRSTGVRLLSCLAAMCCLTSCAPKVLTQVKTQVVLPPEIGCDARPAVPTVDALAGPNGDAVLGTYIARLEAWGADCESAVAAVNAWRAAHLQSAP